MKKEDARVDVCAQPDRPSASTGSTASGFSLTRDEERDVMHFDPWGERDATYKTLRSAFVVSRLLHRCAICFGAIGTGERVWAKTETDYGKIATFRFCAECCWCIAHRKDEDEDDPCRSWERMDERWEIGYRRSRELESATALDAVDPHVGVTTE